jgi:hypothetical protein
MKGRGDVRCRGGESLSRRWHGIGPTDIRRRRWTGPETLGKTRKRGGIARKVGSGGRAQSPTVSSQSVPLQSGNRDHGPRAFLALPSSAVIAHSFPALLVSHSLSSLAPLHPSSSNVTCQSPASAGLVDADVHLSSSPPLSPHSRSRLSPIRSPRSPRWQPLRPPLLPAREHRLSRQ